MIERILEPEVMDSVEEALAYDAMDHSAVNRTFVTDFLEVWHGRGPILDVGTGTAQIPIEFCKQSSSGEIVAIDLANEMLAVARDNVRNAGLEKRIQLQLINARGMPFADGSFSAVISNSIVHHVPDPKHVVCEIVRVAGKGATIFVRDLLRPDDEASLARLVMLYAGGANDKQRSLFEDSLHAALSLLEVRSIISEYGYDTCCVQQTSDRHWTWSVKGA